MPCSKSISGECFAFCALQASSIFVFLQATALESVDPDQWCGDKLHRGPASAQHGQIQLQQVQLHPGTLFPVAEPGGEARFLSRVSVSWPI